MFQLHPQLEKDCHQIAEDEVCITLLHRNSILPWLILVPKGDFTDLDDLPDHIQHHVLARINLLSRFLKSERNCQKINVAALGNLVPQLHIHVVGRFVDDPCWPNPIWGNLEEGAAWAEPDLAVFRFALG